MPAGIPCPHNPNRRCDDCRRMANNLSNEAYRERKRKPKKLKRPYDAVAEAARSAAKAGVPWAPGQDASVDALKPVLRCQNPGCGRLFEPWTSKNGRVRTNRVFDHAHDTGLVRGVLCLNCNSALGMLGDDLTKISGLFEYLLIPPTTRPG